MESVVVVLFMLAAVLASGMLVRVLPFNLPLPLAQIGLGFCIAAFTGGGVELHPDLFFFLFLPPLLFLDGWHIPKDGLIRDRSGVLQLAFALVFFTVLGLGYFIHWMIPSMPLPVAFALAAIISPTDPVAVSAITKRTKMPERVMVLLESESLFNDASGLVAFRFAVAAAVTGTFSLSQAVGSFVWLAVGGIGIGFGFTRLIMSGRAWFVRRFGEEPASEILLSLLTPFAVYFVAEQVEASGILAAVAAGVTMAYAELRGRARAVTRVRRSVVWEVVQFVLNGIMFVVLGEQLPAILRGAVHVVEQAGHHSVAWLAAYPVAICAALILIRFSWIFLSLKVSKAFGPGKKNQVPDVGPRMLWVLSLAGARGTVTLAGVLSLPLIIDGGHAFPARDLAIFLAALVIVLSLLVASVGLPWLLRGYEPPRASRRSEQEALILRVSREAAESHLNDWLTERLASQTPEDAALYIDVAGFVMHDIRGDQSESSVEDSLEVFHLRRAIEREMRLEAIQATRQAIYTLAREHKISDSLAREHTRMLDLLEVHLG